MPFFLEGKDTGSLLVRQFFKKILIMNVIIRPETNSDTEVISQINDAAFEQTNEGQLIVQLRKTDAFIPQLSLLAQTEQGEVVGHILFSKIIVQDGAVVHPSLALAPMSVLPHFQNKGIGSQLVRTGLERAKALGYGSVIVLGHPNYYPRFGFQVASTWSITAPFNVPDEVFMALELVAGGLNGVKGTVVYPAAFGGV